MFGLWIRCSKGGEAEHKQEQEQEQEHKQEQEQKQEQGMQSSSVAISIQKLGREIPVPLLCLHGLPTPWRPGVATTGRSALITAGTARLGA